MTQQQPTPPAHISSPLRPEGSCPVCLGMNLKRNRITVRPSDTEWLYSVRGSLSGRRAFILGCGPSLNLHPPALISRLRDEATFATNFLGNWSGLTFQPSYWCASEEDWAARIEGSVLDWERRSGLVPSSTVRVYAKNRFPATLDSEPLRAWRRVHVEGSMFVKDGFLGGVNEYRISGNPHFAFSGSSVVVDCALQLALWLGADPVYLLGVDAQDALRHAYDRDDRGEGSQARTAGEGGKWQVLIDAVAQAWETAALAGHRVINLSPASALTVPRMTLEETLR